VRCHIVAKHVDCTRLSKFPYERNLVTVTRAPIIIAGVSSAVTYKQ